MLIECVRLSAGCKPETETVCQAGGERIMERLQKTLSSRGACSRREAERLISEGRVTVNGSVACVGMSVDPSSDVIELDGKRIDDTAGKVYILLNKPRGYVTTLKDEKGRRNVTELVSDCGTRVYPAGRLDMMSEGALILTNDGDFANAVAHPSGSKAKIYRVEVTGDIGPALDTLRSPIEINGRMTRPADVRAVREYEGGGVIEVSICEGRNRQVRRLCLNSGLKIRRLVRTHIGEVSLGRLKSGKWRYLTEAEIDSFMKGKMQK